MKSNGNSTDTVALGLEDVLDAEMDKAYNGGGGDTDYDPAKGMADDDVDKTSATTRGHCKLAVIMLAVFCFALLLGGGAMYPYLQPTPRLSAAAPSCAETAPYAYYTPVEWAQACKIEHNDTDQAKVNVVVKALSRFLPCRACGRNDTCGRDNGCVPAATATAADSDAILGILTAAHCSRLKNLTLEDAWNATMFASKLDRWAHALERGNVAATVLAMWGYNTTEKCAVYEP